MTESFGAATLKANGPSISLIDNSRSTGNIGVGNYKGVMLCNRPFAGTLAAPNMTATADKSSFTCGVVPTTVGEAPFNHHKDKFKLQRSKKDSVLSKHKKWLADLQRTKEELESKYLEEQRQKEEAKQKFTDQEAKLRQIARGILHSAESKDNENPETNASSSPQNKNGDVKNSFTSDEKKGGDEAKAAAKENSGGGNSPSVADSKSTVSKAESGAKGGKPAWALTQEAAEKKQEEAALADEEELLRFVENLDFDKTMDDIEVQAMVERLKKKVAELEKEVAADEQREVDAEERARKRELLSIMGQTAALIDQGTQGVKNEEEILNDAAKALLQGDEEMQAVHSTKSVATMLRAARERAVRGTSKGSDGVVLKSNASNEPLIVVHDPNEGTRGQHKNNINNLPYMHRNPAV